MNVKPGDKFMNVHNIRRYECEVIVQKDMSVKQLNSVIQVNDLCVWDSMYKWIEYLELTGTLGKIIYSSYSIDYTNIHIKEDIAPIKIIIL